MDHNNTKIVPLCDVNTALKLHVKKPFKIDKRYICKICGNTGRDIIYIKSGIMRLLYKPTWDIYDNMIYVFKTCADNDICTLKQMESRVFNKVSKCFNIEGKTCVSILNDTNNTLRLKNKKQLLQIYDSKGKICDVSKIDIPQYTQVRALFTIDHFWLTDALYGINYSLVQLQIVEPILIDTLDTCVFTTPQKDPKMLIYEKMLNMGVPLAAVQHKMRLDGVDEGLLQSRSKITAHENKILNAQPKPPPPPPPLPPPPSIRITSNFLKDKSQLRSIVKKVPECQHEGVRPPSLEEILNAKQRLKRPAKLYYAFQLASQ
jgi:hypothetical protein